MSARLPTTVGGGGGGGADAWRANDFVSREMWDGSVSDRCHQKILGFIRSDSSFS